jgi:hypothetical protein
MLEITYAFMGYMMGALALLISLYVWLTVDELVKNGRAWVKLNQELKQRLESMERTTTSTSWKK